MSCPKVSIVLPCYNVESYINEVYKSITESTYENYEIIFVNDGSSDRTAEKIHNLQDKRVKIINKENGGVSSARNAGISAAVGKYILFVDPDDLIDRELIAKVVNKAESSEADFVLFGYKRAAFDNPAHFDNILPKRIYEYSTTEEVINGYMPSIIGISKETISMWQQGGDLYWNKEWGAVWRALYRRDLIVDNNLEFDTSLFLNEDAMFNCHYLCCVQRMVTINECLYTYRVKSSGAMYSSLNSARLLKSKIALANAREKVCEHVYTVIHKDISNWYTGSLVLSIFELFIGLTNNQPLISGYRQCKTYIDRADVKKAVSDVSVGGRIKFAIPLVFIKAKCSAILYFLIHVMNRLGIKMSI